MTAAKKCLSLFQKQAVNIESIFKGVKDREEFTLDMIKVGKIYFSYQKNI